MVRMSFSFLFVVNTNFHVEIIQACLLSISLFPHNIALLIIYIYFCLQYHGGDGGDDDLVSQSHISLHEDNG